MTDEQDPRPGPQAAREGRGRGLHARRGRGADGQGRRADGEVRDRAGAAGRDASPRPTTSPPTGSSTSRLRTRRSRAACCATSARRWAATVSVLTSRSGDGVVLHMFGFRSDVERAEILYTSLLLQMATRHGARGDPRALPARLRGPLSRQGLPPVMDARVRQRGHPPRRGQAENRAKREAEQDETTGNSTALVLADRSLQVKAAMSAAYPKHPDDFDEPQRTRLQRRLRQRPDARTSAGPESAAGRQARSGADR